MAAQVNGEAHPSSVTLSHITGYPVVSDALETIKSNPYGKKSIELGDSAYNTFAKPVIPYFAKPYEYVSPYVKKADDLGDQTLSKIDEHFPIIKKPTGELYNDGKTLVFYPYRKGVQTRDHVFDVYNSEYKKVGGEGLVTTGKAIVSTGLNLTAETLYWIGDFIRAAKAQAKETGHEVQQRLQN